VANKKELFANPLHPYTKALLSAIPILSGRQKRERIILKGEVPGAVNMPSGCRFHVRCPYAKKICSEEVPVLKEKAPSHWAACHIV
jgi:oligopeptide/dipeptide ABC transporter ATP-binding protein